MNDREKSAQQVLADSKTARRMLEWMADGTGGLVKPRDILTPEEYLNDPELRRQAGLISGFGLLGAIFGIVYATFYLLIGHRWGALIIIICSSGFAATPLLMRSKKNVARAGHSLVLTLILGFTALCFVEGGLQGHAIAWLISVPLCAQLLLGQKAATRWAIMAFLAASLVVGLDLAGVRLPVKFDPKWNSLVSATGYLGLLAFLFALGLLFETSRKRAFVKMQEAILELAGANERLVHLNSEKSEFLGIAAHDLKNPLTVILGSAELAGEIKDPKQVSKLLGNISEAATRMNNLINDLLDIDAIEQGKFTSVVRPCNLRELVERVVRDNETAATKKNINIRVGASDDLWVKACPAAAVQVLDNLISNALKYSPPNTTVQMHTLPEADFALVIVRDEGPGISESDQKRLFQKYTRLSARPTGGESSTGLGLAIVKRLAEAMGGTIQCHSTLGAGSAFILRLPVCPPPSSLASGEVRLALPAAPPPMLGRN